MGAITRYGASQMLLSAFIPENSAMPSSLWVALTLSVPPLEATGSSLIEPNVGDYQRVEYSIGADHWLLDGQMTLMNSQDVTWPLPSENWGRIEGWALVDSPAGGLVLASGSIKTSVYVVAGASVSLPANLMRLRMEY